ncbi:MAG: LysR family transcriptional regulator [Novosphingobium sp.]|uniref:LysR family transcriptional regulator n=1 Tax=Novosphingobium sp. TaxID=1874826 RepID=UPI0038C9460E
MNKKTQLPSNFEFRALQAFVVTAEQGGMTRAAEVLGLTQSSVSQTISALETAVGKQLFDRGVRPIVLTGAGHALLRRSQKILGEVQQAFIAAAEAESGGLAALSIAMPESLANVLGPRLYARRAELSRFWRISNGLMPDQRAKFNSHLADIMITEEGNISDLIGVERHLILSEPYVLVFPKGFDLPMELGQHLAERTMIRFSLRSSAGRQTEAQMERLRFKFPMQIEFDSCLAQTTAIANGLGWGISTPLCLFQTPHLLDDVIVRPIGRGAFNRRMTLIARDGALGTAPEIVTTECRSILADEVLPAVVERFPWLEGTCQTGPTG